MKLLKDALRMENEQDAEEEKMAGIMLRRSKILDLQRSQCLIRHS